MGTLMYAMVPTRPTIEYAIRVVSIYYEQCWAKSLDPTENIPATHDPNRNLKFLTSHFPTSNCQPEHVDFYFF